VKVHILIHYFANIERCFKFNNQIELLFLYIKLMENRGKKIKRTGIIQILHYKFDNMMSKGSITLIGWLSIISLSIVILAAGILILTGIKPADIENFSFLEAVWLSMMRTLSSGNLAKDEGWALRIVMFFVTLGGIFFVSTLIGLLNNGIRKKLDSLKKARSFVMENAHTLILGWSPKIFSIINELSLANESEKVKKIVILANKDIEEMEDDIKAKVSDLRKVKIIYRTGNPLDFDDLNMVNPQSAKSILVIAPEDELSDIHVVKTVLAIINDKNRKSGPYHIVAEIKNRKNMEAANTVGRNEIIFILSRDVISKLIVQISRQSGLSIVYSELLGFWGSEIYFKYESTLIGKKFKDLLFVYNDSCVIGIHSGKKVIKLNPPMDTILNQDDELIVVAHDESRINLSGLKNFKIEESRIRISPSSEFKPEKILLLGWNRDAISVLKEINDYVMKGTKITVVASHPKVEESIESARDKFLNQEINYIDGDITKRELLESLDIRQFDHCIVLSYYDIYDIQKSDAITLITLLHLRDIINKLGIKFNIVSQMMDIANKKLAEITKADDFIISEYLISLILSQLSENKHLKDLYDDLFNAEGSEIYLKPVERYIDIKTDTNFYTLVEATSRVNEIAIGYRKVRLSENEDMNYGVVLNPKKDENIKFESGDKLIVVSEHE
jgi:ion channel POLLUX/CASTOR